MRVSLSTGARSVLAVVAVTAVVSGAASNAQARDFFSSFFDTLSGRPEPAVAVQPALGYNGAGGPQFPPRTQTPSPGPSASVGRSMAYCVRTCDGRYFPLSSNNEQSRAATCRDLCPASETKVYYGRTIDNAASEGGKSYSALPNAFKYREQFVSGCTCNGKDPVGLASISIDDDKTLRKGDIVAGENGLIVATRTMDKKHGRLADFSTAPQRIRAKFERAQALALE